RRGGGLTMAGEGKSAASGAGLRLHHLRPAPGAHKARTRVGRGEASKGKTAGRGTKGTKARSQVPASFEGGQMPLHRRVPQLPGFSKPRIKAPYPGGNPGRAGRAVPGGGQMAPGGLAAKGAVRPGELVKILGTGDVSAPLQVTAHA